MLAQITKKGKRRQVIDNPRSQAPSPEFPSRDHQSISPLLGGRADTTEIKEEDITTILLGTPPMTTTTMTQQILEVAMEQERQERERQEIDDERRMAGPSADRESS